MKLTSPDITSRRHSRTCLVPRNVATVVIATAALVAFVTPMRSVKGAENTRAATNIEEALRLVAGDVIEHCRAEGYQQIGVLKFMVVKNPPQSSNTSSETLGQTIGTIHHSLARKLEVALLLANDRRDPIGIIDDASSVAAANGEASYLEADQRPQLLRERYPLHWGKRKVLADVMVTGLVQIDEDLRAATMSLMIFSARHPDLGELGGERRIRVDASWLPEIGESFSLSRGAFDGGRLKTSGGDNKDPSDFPDDLPDGPDPGPDDEQTLAAAVNVRDENSHHPLRDPNAAVRVEVIYDGKIIRPTITNGVATVAEPRTGQRVRIDVIKDDTTTRYGVCVKINGESTLNRTRLPDFACRKWILSHAGQRLSLLGYQVNDDEVEEFRVLSDHESNLRELDYGKDVGTISVTVFPEGKSTSAEDDEQTELELIASTKLPKRKPGTFGLLKEQLLGRANRGLIVEGNLSSNRINRRKFSTTRTPILSTTIVYYKP